jgi:hypothetical protein
MEIFIKIISLVFLSGLLLCPILLLRYLNQTNIKCKFFIYILSGIILTALIAFLFAWWADTSNILILKHYGYIFEGWGEEENYRNVAPENLERVKSLLTSHMGIGWPLKAAMTYIFYSPYLFIAYLVNYIIGRKSR